MFRQLKSYPAMLYTCLSISLLIACAVGLCALAGCTKRSVSQDFTITLPQPASRKEGDVLLEIAEIGRRQVDMDGTKQDTMVLVCRLHDTSRKYDVVDVNTSANAPQVLLTSHPVYDGTAYKDKVREIKVYLALPKRGTTAIEQIDFLLEAEQTRPLTSKTLELADLRQPVEFYKDEFWLIGAETSEGSLPGSMRLRLYYIRPIEITDPSRSASSIRLSEGKRARLHGLNGLQMRMETGTDTQVALGITGAEDLEDLPGTFPKTNVTAAVNALTRQGKRPMLFEFGYRDFDTRKQLVEGFQPSAVSLSLEQHEYKRIPFSFRDVPIPEEFWDR